jgi:hypothetical protein
MSGCEMIKGRTFYVYKNEQFFSSPFQEKNAESEREY